MAVAPIVVLDACVLYPAALRDLFMRLAAHGLIQAKWSAKIHDEWMTAILRERADLTLERLQKTRELMDKHAGDCLVTGFERHMQNLALPDPDDRHVLAAAIECEADAVVTWNLADFPANTVGGHGIEVWTPDDLVMELLRQEQDSVIETMREHRVSLRNPPKSQEEYLDTLRQQRLIRTVESVKKTGKKL
ncbi:MAG TPA: PIN domain-containing protein [Candidatus Saccharimonadia bacterium]|nr:PIN domain-containing protein [Candidatus Saccharimonadia bacterium]